MNTVLDLTSLKKAVVSLEAAIKQTKNEFLRDSVVQRFEYTYELCWKFLARHLEQDIGSIETDRLSRKDLFRISAEKGLLDDPSVWFTYHSARDRTSQMYDEKVAEEVYQVALTFLPPAKQLLQKLELLHAQTRVCPFVSISWT